MRGAASTGSKAGPRSGAGSTRSPPRACLTALEARGRRPLPSGLGAPSEDHRVAVADRDPSVPWLQPVPDTLLGAPGSGDPAVVAAARAGVRLAFIAALQLLPARQRAILTLHDVLAFGSGEIAGLLDTTPGRGGQRAAPGPRPAGPRRSRPG